VIWGHNVGAAPARVGVDRLLVGERHHCQEADGRQGNREGIAERARAGHGEDKQDLLRGVGRGGQRIGGEDSQPN
jgi:hypothetical protein